MSNKKKRTPGIFFRDPVMEQWVRDRKSEQLSQGKNVTTKQIFYKYVFDIDYTEKLSQYNLEDLPKAVVETIPKPPE